LWTCARPKQNRYRPACRCLRLARASAGTVIAPRRRVLPAFDGRESSSRSIRRDDLTDRRVAPFPRIVAMGGGTGLPTILRGLAEALGQTPCANGHGGSRDTLSAIVTVTDDGGSSGRLRRDLGVLPPGDVRNCLAALSSDAAFTRLMAHRFDARTDLDGHAVGNLLLAALTQMTGSFVEAIDEMASLLKACGRVYPSTCEDVTLRAEL